MYPRCFPDLFLGIRLAEYARQRVRLTLRTDPRDELSFDRAGWGDPVVVVPRR